MQDRRDLVLEQVELLLAELAELRCRGPHFRIHHRFRKPGTVCSHGEEILAVCLVHSGREYCLPLSLALRILFDYLAQHTRFPQSAAQIEAGIRADRFYTQHASAVMGKDKFTRTIPRSYVRVYIGRLRSALTDAFQNAGLLIDASAVILTQKTVMNEVGYRTNANFTWIHLDSH
jgi:hypothetical protein